MDKEIIKIEINVKDDRYFQAVALLVDNPRFLKVIEKNREKFIDGEKLFQFGMDDRLRFQNAKISSEIAKFFRFPPHFSFIIYTAMVYGEVNDMCVTELEKIDWSLEYKLAKKYKDSQYSRYLCQKPFETKKRFNIREARENYWNYRPYKNGYRKMADGDECLKETIRSRIRVYRNLINY